MPSKIILSKFSQNLPSRSSISTGWTLIVLIFILPGELRTFWSFWNSFLLKQYSNNELLMPPRFSKEAPRRRPILRTLKVTWHNIFHRSTDSTYCCNFIQTLKDQMMKLFQIFLKETALQKNAIYQMYWKTTPRPWYLKQLRK